MIDLPIALIEVKSIEDISILLQMDNPLAHAEIDGIMITFLRCERWDDPMPIFDKLLEREGFWVADENKLALLEELKLYYRE